MQNNKFSEVIVAQNLVTLKEVDSTNTFLKKLLSNTEPVNEGTVILAESQTAGRGQQLNRWYSSANESLAFSLLLLPSFLPLENQFNLIRIVSLGVYDALSPLVGKALKIKWPNDIYINDLKLGGILIENQVQGGKIKSSVAGIGLNINQHAFPDWVPNAVSLKQILHKDYDLKALMFDICNHIGQWYIKLKAGDESQIEEAYLNTLYWLNKPGSFKAQDAIFGGTITGVSKTGLLQVNCNGVTAEYNLKEIEFLNK
ncbi:biotin--[acetyl-CoA-carboxylase] ligase [uncultured Mucilaginibacter sp.]|uniref:biotin--[acetyl-CoA-carboxylase] ligase n=1 Tax=uncultured Mucilaginibacter sp. TaxID=797541 RepID=UPI0025FA10F5|nr:biotin--[acetyl-CoA-carboxylase] ligase [uncultured Mucilaginibacter sp.]